MNMIQIDSKIKISSVRREHGKAILTLSNGEIRAMPRAMLKERPYKSGMPFDEEAFQSFISERSYPFAMDKAVALLSMRARTEKEIVDALRMNTYPEATIARVMQRLQEAGYVNDSEFAVQYSSARVLKGMGSRRIRMELRNKGIESDIIDQTISDLDQEDVLKGAITTARKAVHGKNISDRADRQKVLASLARRGYDYQIARQALDILLQEMQ